MTIQSICPHKSLSVGRFRHECRQSRSRLGFRFFDGRLKLNHRRGQNGPHCGMEEPHNRLYLWFNGNWKRMIKFYCKLQS